MKALLIGDVHLSDRPPSSCTDTYADDLFDLLGQCAELADRESCDVVVQAGDYWHHKAPGRTSHRLVQRAIRQLREFPCPVYIVPGNHDVTHDQLDSIGATQPLGVLFESGAARRLEGWAGDNLPLYGVPWQQEWSERVIRDALADFREHLFGRALVVTHAPIYPPGREPRYEGAEYTPARWWAQAIDDGPFEHGLLYGHIHEAHGVYAADDSGLRFCNHGALSRGSLDEYNLHREVGVTLWSEGGGFEFVPLKAKPAEEVFRLRRHEEVATAQRSLADFQDRLSAVKLSVLSVETVIAHIREGGHPAAVTDLAEELLTAEQGGA